MIKLIYAIILTLLPVSELRGGLPLAISYAIENNIPIALIFPTIILLNILVIFFVFYFLDNLHGIFMKNNLYKKIAGKAIERIRKKVDRFEKKNKKFDFIALMFFVAVPLPGTGAWSGCLLSWILGLERKQSILAISLGVIIAGTIILLGSLGFMKVFNFL